MHFFAWKENGFWRGGDLLTKSQIRSALCHLKHQETFASIQTYTENGEITACPIYADFDHRSDLELVRRQVIDFVTVLIQHFNTIPLIYFSGNKGFHVVMPYWINHPRCHHIVQNLLDQIMPKLSTLDRNVYKTHSMLRTVGSPGSQPGRHKVQLFWQELLTLDLTDIIQLSEKNAPRTIDECDRGKLDNFNVDLLVKVATDELPELSSYTPQITVGRPMTACLSRIFLEGINEGNRNRAVFILAKHFKLAGYSVTKTEQMFMEQPHFYSWESSGAVKVLSVIRSIFRNQRTPILGCKSGLDGELLKEYCNPLCVFSDSFPDLNIRIANGSKTRQIANEAASILSSQSTQTGQEGWQPLLPAQRQSS